MEVLLLSSRPPWPPYSGDRLRASVWLEALRDVARVTLVAPDGPVPADAPPFRFVRLRRSALYALRGVARVAAGAPLQSLPAASYDWRGAIDCAHQAAGSFDASIVLLSRLDPWVRDSLPRGLHVLDAIDALERNTLERAREASPLTRWFWRSEAARIGRVEADAARVYDEILVVNRGDCGAFGTQAVSNGITIAARYDGPRPFDFGFWGRLPYFANRDAAEWLLAEIWPAIRARRPQATLVIGGAQAQRSIFAAHGRDGITVQSPFDDTRAFTRRVKVALFPIRFGTGEATKALEAAEGGCAIVSTEKGMRGVDALAEHASIAEDAGSLARLAADTLADDVRRAMSAKLRTAVEAHYARGLTLQRLAAIVQRQKAAA